MVHYEPLNLDDALLVDVERPTGGSPPIASERRRVAENADMRACDVENGLVREMEECHPVKTVLF